VSLGCGNGIFPGASVPLYRVLYNPSILSGAGPDDRHDYFMHTLLTTASEASILYASLTSHYYHPLNFINLMYSPPSQIPKRSPRKTESHSNNRSGSSRDNPPPSATHSAYRTPGSHTDRSSRTCPASGTAHRGSVRDGRCASQPRRA
jgi:hypothetical protein